MTTTTLTPDLLAAAEAVVRPADDLSRTAGIYLGIPHGDSEAVVRRAREYALDGKGRWLEHLDLLRTHDA